MNTQNKNWIFGIGGFVVGLIVACIWFWTSGAPAWTMPLMSRFGFDERVTSRGNMMGDFDSHFIEQMIPHHADAVLMADIAIEKAEHKELKELAAAIKSDQAKEIEMMKGWYEDWYGDRPEESTTYMGHGGMHHVTSSGPGMMMGGVRGDEEDTTALRNAEPFDKAFIEQMIPHHQMAVMMAEMTLLSAERQEVRDLAQAIIAAQNSEIEKMRSWYEAWY